MVTSVPPAATVAIVHDYLNQCGGAERVALELARAWPGARTYTSLYRPGSTFPGFREQNVTVSLLDRLPVDTQFRALAPLYPMAFHGLGELKEDVVISSSSGWAHGVRTAPESLHIVYCHTPARWLYRPEDHLGPSAAGVWLRPLLAPLRRWDQAAAQRADVYLANSEYVRRRIRTFYGREAKVVHPPADVARFTPRERGDRLLVVSRLLPYKRTSLIIRAANRAGLGLNVVGVGPCMAELRTLAGPTVKFHGRVGDTELRELMESCRALCVAATEDFGLAPIEANAAGKPVVAYAAGGALETVTEGVNGTFFHELEEAALIRAVERADRLDASPEQLAETAQRFSVDVFREKIRSVIQEELERRQQQTGSSMRRGDGTAST